MEFYSRKDYIEKFGIPFRVHFFSQRLEIMHFHDFDELVIILCGSGIHRTATMDTPVSAGDVFLIRGGEHHLYVNNQHLQLVNVMFDSSSLKLDWQKLNDIPGFKTLFETEPELRERTGFQGKLTITSDQLNDVRKILQKIQQEMDERHPSWEIMSLTLLQELFITLARSYSFSGQKQSRRMFNLARMIQFIEKNYSSDISRDQIMYAGNVSNAVGSRIFKEFLGKSPVEYLNFIRIQHAVELLKNGQESVASVARLCGFRDSNYFSSCFKKSTGYSPRQFKRWTTNI